MKMKKNRFLLCGMLTAAALLASACGGTTTEQTTGSATSTESGAATETAQASETVTADKAGVDDRAQKLIGGWEAVAIRYENHSTEGEGDSSSYYFIDYEEGDTSMTELLFYEEDGQLKADYVDYSYYAPSYYGMKASVVDGKLYDGCANTEWKCEMTSTAAKEKGFENTVSLVADNVLEVFTTYDYSEYGYTYESITTYLREGSEENENRESYRYRNEVEVFDVVSLMNALTNDADSKKIILKEGVYDITGWENPFQYLNNVCLSGEEGAKVEICITNCYEDVISLEGCYGITLENLTLGHAVEKGECSGDVIACNQSSNIAIKNCNLYGSGAYGVSASDSYSVSVIDCDIYECSYGLLDLYSSNDFAFTGCTFRDTEGYGMLNLYSCYWVTFEDCVFKNTKCYEGCEFMSWPDSMYVSFNSCSFMNNQYDSFSESEADFNNCVYE